MGDTFVDLLVPLRGPRWLKEHHVLLKVLEAFLLSLFASRASMLWLTLACIFLFVISLQLECRMKERLMLLFYLFLTVLMMGFRFATMAFGTYILYRSTPMSRLGEEIAGIGRLIGVPLVSVGLMIQLVFLFLPELLTLFYARLIALKNRGIRPFMRIVYLLTHILEVLDELIDRRVLALQNRIAFEHFGALSRLSQHDLVLPVAYVVLFALAYVV